MFLQRVCLHAAIAGRLGLLLQMIVDDLASIFGSVPLHRCGFVLPRQDRRYSLTTDRRLHPVLIRIRGRDGAGEAIPGDHAAVAYGVPQGQSNGLLRGQNPVILRITLGSLNMVWPLLE